MQYPTAADQDGPAGVGYQKVHGGEEDAVWHIVSRVHNILEVHRNAE